MSILPVDIDPTQERDLLETNQGRDCSLNRDTQGHRAGMTRGLGMTSIRGVDMTRGQGTTKGNKVEISQDQGLELPQVIEIDSGLHTGPSLHLHTDQNLLITLRRTDKAGHPIAHMIMTEIVPIQLGIRTHS
jgi:hypothetical protein